MAKQRQGAAVQTETGNTALMSEPIIESHTFVAEPEESEDERPLKTRTCSICSTEFETRAEFPWCKTCRATRQREYMAQRGEMDEKRGHAKGYAEGVAAAKQFLAREFQQKVGTAQLSGHEAARLVLACKGPNLPSS